MAFHPTTFDIGYPLWFYSRGAPAALNPRSGEYLGPCFFNKPTIILSHWDWDHWRLAKIAHDQGAYGGVDVIDLEWIFPVQYIGTAASNFRNSLTKPTPWPKGMASMPLANGQIVRCIGRDINNSGLAIILRMLLPTGDPDVHLVIFTGDASFENVHVPADGLLFTGITAVHHGSDSHGAADHLPNPCSAESPILMESTRLAEGPFMPTVILGSRPSSPTGRRGLDVKLAPQKATFIRVVNAETFAWGCSSTINAQTIPARSRLSPQQSGSIDDPIELEKPPWPTTLQSKLSPI